LIELGAKENNKNTKSSSFISINEPKEKKEIKSLGKL
jgi:hypothetical protein